jgi:hypothetical protein
MMSEHTVGVKRGREYLHHRVSSQRQDSTAVAETWKFLPVHHYIKEPLTVSALRNHVALNIQRGENSPACLNASCLEPFEEDGSTSVEESSIPPHCSSSCDADDDYLVGASFSFEDFDEQFFALQGVEERYSTQEAFAVVDRCTHWVPDEQHEPEVEIFDFEL